MGNMTMTTNLKLIAARNTIKRLVKNEKGATAVEYTLMLVAVLIAVSAAFNSLGRTTSSKVRNARGGML
jgi:Flp pilus assembly pilin Flp